jgi:glycerol-3-phosphate dehydrogenase
MPGAFANCPTSVDLLVLGGGITGAGIARDAALRGMSVALFEKGDYASGTSSKSSKLVHGGLRYLEQGEIALVFESVSERRVQTTVAPHLVRPLPFLVPIFDGAKPGLELMNIGLWIYDALALFRAPRMHKTFRGAAKALALEPQLRRDGLRGVLEYYDCATDDARLVIENIVDAKQLGAYCGSYQEVVRIERNAAGHIVAVTARDRFSNETHRVACQSLIFSAGAWTDEMIAKLDVPTTGFGRKKLLRRTKGVHIVVPRERLPLARAITLMSPVDGRVMFAIPWRERTVLGTTDTDFTGTADEVCADADDVKYLIASGNGYFPNTGLTTADVIATWAGLRPLIAGPEDAQESEVSREHEIIARDDGMVIIAGGKLTTYRLMAKQAVNAAVKLMKSRALTVDAKSTSADDDDDESSADKAPLAITATKKRPLPGAAGLTTSNLEGIAEVGRELMDRLNLDADTATHLCGVYGSRARILGDVIAADPSRGLRIESDLPYVWAEIDFAVEHDLARTVEDVLSRRVPLLLVSRDQGLTVSVAVAQRMAQRLGWSDDVVAANLAEYRAEVALSRRWQTTTG